MIRILAEFGYKPVRQTGSHIHLLHPDTRRLVTVPNHPGFVVHYDAIISDYQMSCRNS